MLVHVEVVVGALLDAPHPGQLRQDHAARADGVHELEAVEHAIGAHDPLELGEDALGRDLWKRAGARRGGAPRVLVDLELELAGKAGEAERAQGVVGERVRGHHPQPAAA